MSIHPVPNRFRIALTADFVLDGNPRFDAIDFSELIQQKHVNYGFLSDENSPVGPDQLEGVNALMVLSPAINAETVSSSDDLLAISRFGVGYDQVDVAACTDADVLVLIATGAVDRPMAEAIVTWMLALTHHVCAKDQLVRDGRWNDRSELMGRELRDRTLGLIGLGGIGKTLVRLLSAFGMKQPLAFDPYVSSEEALGLDVRLADLPTLMSASDFVVVCCPLTDETRGLVGDAELGHMRDDSYIINAARGGIVDEDALFSALQERAIAGAAVDVFEDEPLTDPHRFGTLENVLLAPHCIGWTEELFRDIWRTACKGVLDLSLGRCPGGVVNKSVLDKSSFRSKWERITGGTIESGKD